MSREHNIKDDEFFINRRDLPMLKKDGSSCYSFAGAKNPKHQCFLKVYSLYQGKDWLDLSLCYFNAPWYHEESESDEESESE